MPAAPIRRPDPPAPALRPDAPTAGPPLPLAGGAGLARGRVHEGCGPARRTLAVLAARAVAGPVIWIAPAWAAERLHPEGVQPFLSPGRLVFVSPARAEDLLWSVEECLRAGAAALVVAELPDPPGLTPVRRLQLAAAAGAAEGAAVPTGLLLLPGEGGAPGVESRWHLAPLAAGGWRLERRRARTAPPAAWTLAPGPRGRLAAAPAPPPA